MELPGFDLAWRGFNRAQVREFVREVETELRRVAAERDEAIRRGEALAAKLTAAQEENRELKATVDRISRVPIAPDALQERSRRMLELTREEAEEITARATEEAAKAEAERKRITEDFERAMTLRRAEAMRALAAQDEAAQARARKLLDDAAEEGERLVAEARQKADVALRLRDDVLKQLVGCRELLAEAGTALTITDEPKPEVPVQRRSRSAARAGAEAAATT
ncbi:M protein [Amycolatopsis regifaucium]|uniref:M protein n=1 Tax=Amycolatopsis regifaucium TaxID=546365 RepID=A0A154MII6_9PSEU|nr:M protein [Amycolatopsis regifaucium]KZB84165.1 M protein [Amycolatopsis regifaucium]OKA08657.1 M protein [Amycolatopsis regifaucium]SFJ58488.1 DivIVA protein [Amycolatopsis regifaucium]